MNIKKINKLFWLFVLKMFLIFNWLFIINSIIQSNDSIAFSSRRSYRSSSWWSKSKNRRRSWYTIKKKNWTTTRWNRTSNWWLKKGWTVRKKSSWSSSSWWRKSSSSYSSRPSLKSKFSSLKKWQSAKLSNWLKLKKTNSWKSIITIEKKSQPIIHNYHISSPEQRSSLWSMVMNWLALYGGYKLFFDNWNEWVAYNWWINSEEIERQQREIEDIQKDILKYKILENYIEPRLKILVNIFNREKDKKKREEMFNELFNEYANKISKMKITWSKWELAYEWMIASYVLEYLKRKYNFKKEITFN